MTDTKTIAPTGTEAGFDLDKLEALMSAAKVGHWTAVKHSWSNVGIYSAGRPVACLSIIDDAIEETQDALEAEMDADAAFMVAACNALPALIALARRDAPATSTQPDTAASASGEKCPTCFGRGYTDAGDPETGATKDDYLCTECAGTGRAAQPVQAGGAVDARALFEHIERASNLTRGKDGDYENPCTQSAWEGFQAGRASLAPVSAQQGAADEPLCPACQGSGEGLMMEGAGPDSYEVPCNCPYCGGSGGLLDAYNVLVALLAAEREKYLNACGKLFHANFGPQQGAAKAPAAQAVVAWLIDPGPGSARDRVTTIMPDAFVYADVLARGGSITELVPRAASPASTPEAMASERQPATQQAGAPVAWIATDLDGRAGVGFTKEEAKRQAGEGCTEFIPLFDLGDAAPTQQEHALLPFAAPAGQHGAWIAAIDRLPKKYEEVIVWPHPTDDLMTAELWGENASGNPVWKYCEYTNGWGYENIELTRPVTHWMPRPQAPDESNTAGAAKGGITNDSGAESLSAHQAKKTEGAQ